MKCENWATTTTSGELIQVQYYSSDFHSPITTLDHPTLYILNVCSEVEYIYINAQVNVELDHSGSETIRLKQKELQSYGNCRLSCLHS